MPLVGDELAGYRLLAVLGRGGMSVVYQAENPRLGSVVALKVLAPELANNDVFRARFLQESRTAASLNHPNVIPIYDMGAHQDLLYIAMRYVAGSDLRNLIRTHHRLTPTDSLYLITQAGRALDFAHQHDLVHRDVKPANMLVERAADDDDPDHVYLADFGITKHALSRSGLTPTGQFMGTLDYVAPEQIRGGEVDRRADIYSLGCVLFECLTGQVPFVKDVDAAVLWAHVEEPAPRASTLRTGLPTALDDVIARALAKDPSDRYPTCRQMMTEARAVFGDPDLTRVRVLSRPGTAQPPRAPHDVPPTLDGPRDLDAPPSTEVSATGVVGAPRTTDGSPLRHRPPLGQSSRTSPTSTGGTPRRSRWAAVAAALALAVVVGGVAGIRFATRGVDPPRATAHQVGSQSSMTTGTSPSNASSMPMSPSPSAATTVGALMQAVVAANAAVPGSLPPKSCTAENTTHVSCVPTGQGGQLLADFRTFHDLHQLYDAYAARVRTVSGHPLRANVDDCNSTHPGGETSWKHDYTHTRQFSLAESQSGMLSDDQAAGRVFCTLKGDDLYMIWTENDGRMLGQVMGYPHPIVFPWWRDVHHALGIHHAMKMPQ